MVTMQSVLSHLTGQEIVDALIERMEELFADFSLSRKKYLAAIDLLREELGESGAPGADDLAAAINQKTASNLVFCGSLGLKANLDHFMDPVARNFMDVDFDVFLREITAQKLPAYVEAEGIENAVYKRLSAEQKKIYECVNDYESHLETIGPKLAHYYGYLMGNDLLQRIIPGYHSDPALTIQYCSRLEEYLGIRLADPLA